MLLRIKVIRFKYLFFWKTKNKPKMVSIIKIIAVQDIRELKLEIFLLLYIRK